MELYKLADQFLQVTEMIENGVEGLEDTLELLDLSFEEKVENCVKAYRNLIAERDMCKAEAHRLTERARALDKQSETLKQYAETMMRRVGKEEVKSTLFKIKLQMNPPSVNITNDDLIPADYYVRPVPTISKTLVMNALKSGIEVPGAEIKQEKSLRIS